jgi:ketosteroid isomerase-like protein
MNRRPLHPTLVAFFLVTAICTTTNAQTIYEPSADDPRILAVIEARKRRDEAMRARDIESVKKFIATDLVVNAPINRVVDGANMLARLSRGEIAYDDEGVSTVEFMGVRDDLVVVMGGGVLNPVGNAPNAGKTIRRRWTDVWKNIDGQWKMIIRQATVFSVE